MTYNVFGGTLNIAQLNSCSYTLQVCWVHDEALYKSTFTLTLQGGPN